ncbi:MAG TPA: DNA polymerase Y family protein [Gemmataceae bacterium]|nr:DNA polymerase Y family protein [Gemmataceae bacterium]
MKRVMCAHFPKWPLQRLQHEQPELRDKPVVLSDSSAARRPQIILCSERATRLGIRPGLPIAEAVAIAPDLCIREEDAEKDRRLLERLAERIGRYSPLVGLEDGPSPQSLLADITGCAPLFHGEDRLMEKAAGELRENGWTVRIAITDTVGASWALAHYAKTPCLMPPSETGKFLRPLPIAALRLPDESLHLLSELGIDHIGQLLALPRTEIPARFGAEVLRRLDQALGRLPEVVLPCRTMPEPQAFYCFEYATDRFDVLKSVLKQLAEQIHAVLLTRQWGARQIECCLYYETAPPSKLEVSLVRPCNSLQHLTGLLRTRLEQAQLVEPVCAVGLRVMTAEPLLDHQTDFLGLDQAQAFQELSALIDRLSNRLGRNAVTRPALIPDPQPEYACHFNPVIQAENEGARGRLPKSPRLRKSQAAASLPSFTHRPLRLWPTPTRIEVIRVIPGGPPRLFRWAGTEYHVIHTWGPERIETGWWRGQDVHRDYYMVTTHVGTRFWLFLRRDDGRWFLHGCFD